jgi:hypothetical protein
MQLRLSLTAAAVAVGAAFATPVAAHETVGLEARIDGALEGARPGQFVPITPFGPTRRAPGGLLEIRLPDGEVVRTHGVDPAPAPEPPTGSASAAGDALSQRRINCAAGPRLRVLYVHPADRRSRWSGEMYGRIRTYMEQMSYRLHADALASSQGRIGADYRVRCDSSDRIDIKALKSTTTAARDDWSVIQGDLKRAGYDSRDGKYLIWYDDPVGSACGIANIWNDDRKSSSNRNNSGPRYAAVFGNTRTRTCWTARVGMHENGHNMGAVQLDAPRSSGDRWHCNDGLDVMCYADGGDRSRYSTTRCAERVFDCGKDTYFDTLTEPGEWLRDHWNIGWSGNRFLDFLRSDAAGSGSAP